MTETFQYDVFLSHNSTDKPEVELLAHRLTKQAGLRVFFDSWSLVPGERWIPALEAALNQSATVAIFLGASGSGPWHEQERQIALINAVRSKEEFRVIPVLLPGAEKMEAEGFLALRTWVEFRTGIDDEMALTRLVAGIKGEAIGSDNFELPEEPAPYRGLDRFEAEHSEIFFGRDADFTSVIKKIASSNFVAIIGASGCGKSSLVRAGVLPRLVENAIPGSQYWRTITFQPGANPWRSLAGQLVDVRTSVARLDAVDSVSKRLAKSSHGLMEVLAALHPDDSHPYFLVIDQFEEVFTHVRPSANRPVEQNQEPFVDALYDAVYHSGNRIRVVITLRADFLDLALKLPRLRDLLQDRQYLLGEMGVTALREAIVEPARKVGAFLEQGLVPLILRDVGEQVGSLPLLQHALNELWRSRSGAWLTVSSYEKSGGVRGALHHRAQATYDNLENDTQKRIAHDIFLRLTNLGDGVSETRRRVPRQELYARTYNRNDVDKVLEKLSGPTARLIRLDRESAEVTHEALFKTWSTLRTWLVENREAIRLHRHLTQAANEWKEKGEKEGDLYQRGSARLAETQEWVKVYEARMNPLERQFFEASIALRKRKKQEFEVQNREQARLRARQELAEERLAQEQELAKRKQAQLRSLLGVAGVIAIALGIWVLIAVSEARDAEAFRAAAEEEAAIAENRSSRALKVLSDAQEKLNQVELREKTLKLRVKAIKLLGEDSVRAFRTAEQAERLLPSPENREILRSVISSSELLYLREYEGFTVDDVVNGYVLLRSRKKKDTSAAARLSLLKLEDPSIQQLPHDPGSEAFLIAMDNTWRILMQDHVDNDPFYITVGRPVTRPPPYRSPHAELPHGAPQSYSLRTVGDIVLLLRSCGICVVSGV